MNLLTILRLYMELGIAIKKIKIGSLLKKLWSTDIRITALTRRIIFFNIIGLFVLIGVMISVYLPRFKEQMISQRIEFLQKHGELVALIVAEAAGRTAADGTLTYDPLAANQVLRRIISEVGGRAQLYDRTGRLTADTRNIFGVLAPIDAQALDPITNDDILETAFEKLSRKIESFFSPTYPTYQETSGGGIAKDPEIYSALDGSADSAVRANSSEDLIVSTAVPVQKFKAVMGALVLSTDSGDIDTVVYETRRRILELFSIILIVSIIVSIVVSYTIAYPITKLTRATGALKKYKSDTNKQRITIPDMQNRGDEIGELSASLRHMTEAFYSRIEAIESFAADVSHEIKNPLTSLRSAVEAMRIVKKSEDKESLMNVIESDVYRMDRLLTDISNASRLDAELVREKSTTFDLAILLQVIIDSKVSTVTEALPIEFILSLHTSSIFVEGLENRLAQVFQNIIGNSLSFIHTSANPKIIIETTRISENILISISDTGPGIPKESLELIFDRFYSARPPQENFGQHSGLGLSICEQIVKAHSGKIWAENVDLPAKGAKFCILIPLLQSQKKII